MGKLVAKGVSVEHMHVPGAKPELHFYDETDQVVETVQVGSWKEEDIEAFLNAKLVIA